MSDASKARPLIPPCDVCGEPGVIVRQSGLPLPVSFAYCQSCSNSGLEPLDAVEAFLRDEHEREDRVAGEPELVPKSLTDEIVKRSVAFHSSREVG